MFFIILIPSVLAHDNKKKKYLEAHEHGAGELNIVQEDNNLLFEFKIPGYNIVGFEYEAKQKEDVKKVEEALDILSNYENMIIPSKLGKCENISNSSEVINEGTHSEFITEYKFNCQKVSELKKLMIKCFSKFENFRKLNVTIIGKNKQITYEIKRSKLILDVKNYF